MSFTASAASSDDTRRLAGAERGEQGGGGVGGGVVEPADDLGQLPQLAQRLALDRALGAHREAHARGPAAQGGVHHPAGGADRHGRPHDDQVAVGRPHPEVGRHLAHERQVGGAGLAAHRRADADHGGGRQPVGEGVDDREPARRQRGEGLVEAGLVERQHAPAQGRGPLGRGLVAGDARAGYGQACGQREAHVPQPHHEHVGLRRSSHGPTGLLGQAREVRVGEGVGRWRRGGWAGGVGAARAGGLVGGAGVGGAGVGHRGRPPGVHGWTSTKAWRQVAASPTRQDRAKRPAPPLRWAA